MVGQLIANAFDGEPERGQCSSSKANWRFKLNQERRTVTSFPTVAIFYKLLCGPNQMAPCAWTLSLVSRRTGARTPLACHCAHEKDAEIDKERRRGRSKDRGAVSAAASSYPSFLFFLLLSSAVFVSGEATSLLPLANLAALTFEEGYTQFFRLQSHASRRRKDRPSLSRSEKRCWICVARPLFAWVLQRLHQASLRLRELLSPSMYASFSTI
ncbi:hypothetical protein ZIOFF_045436 [Zingiber officinale]|uniref:Uncharacterized protein n=1 Tax=Zingiber officinale TaxID=94328 RepID=A0A8J5FZ43_ZINOF|nr:hypothetical protein ZIOFF_045436 [Zingiber officinale]